MVNKFFEIIYESNFSAIVNSLKKKHPRIEEVVDDLNWACQKNPFLGTIIDQNNTYEARVIHTSGIGKTPAFWVLIEINKTKEEVVFIALQPLEENHNN